LFFLQKYLFYAIKKSIFLLKIHILKNSFSQHKIFFTFLAKFLLFYIAFSATYSLYLSQFDAKKNELDGFTQLVASQSVKIMSFFSEDVKMSPHEFQPAVQVIYNGKYVARVVEGCNGLSVMILFAAFIFAFSAQWKKTTLYILIGIMLLHLLNCVRIAFLCFALFHYKQYGVLLHGTIFPLIIYGAVFLLWILWVTQFSGYVRTTPK
jgi:exosortase family protein XrtF